MKTYDVYVASFLTALSGVTCILAYRLSLGSIHNPGAGLIPFGVAALLGLMSIGLLVKGLLRSNVGSQRERVFRGVEWWGVALTLCGLLGYGAVFNHIGFRLSTLFLMLLLVGGVGRQKVWLALTVSLCTVVFAYLIFVVWLRCPFPSGPFGI
ncbi:MAG TPA: tripartite tricarboxylate transporter TctB family protein [Thermodesulfobacteriota bacterium]|nr:tripartite tricarboxylate transporter TctB family protein [Thermodesulfobacteriota bacterium]